MPGSVSECRPGVLGRRKISMEAQRNGSRHRITSRLNLILMRACTTSRLLGAYKYRNPTTVKSELRTFEGPQVLLHKVGGGQPSGFACTSLCLSLSPNLHVPQAKLLAPALGAELRCRYGVGKPPSLIFDLWLSPLPSHIGLDTFWLFAANPL